MAVPATVDTTPAGLAAGLHAMSNEIIPDIGLATTQVAMEELFMDVVKLAPKGSVKTSPHPGKLKASVKASAGRKAFAKLQDATSYPIPGITEVLAVTQGMELGEAGYITDDATTDGAEGSYAPSIEAGLRVGPAKRTSGKVTRSAINGAKKSKGKKKGNPNQRYGSTQAPHGFFGPSVENLTGRAAQVMTKAIRRTLKRKGL